MKKTILLVLVLVLTLCLLAGCRNGSTDTSAPIGSSGDMTPNASNGAATDGDGFIGDETGAPDGQNPRNGDMMPGPISY